MMRINADDELSTNQKSRRKLCLPCAINLGFDGSPALLGRVSFGTDAAGLGAKIQEQQVCRKISHRRKRQFLCRGCSLRSKCGRCACCLRAQNILSKLQGGGGKGVSLTEVPHARFLEHQRNMSPRNNKQSYIKPIADNIPPKEAAGLLLAVSKW